MIVYHLYGGKSNNIYLLWTKNTQYPTYWFASKYASSMLFSQVQSLHIRLNWSGQLLRPAILAVLYGLS